MTGNITHWYCSSIVIKVIKQRRMRWVGHVACVGEKRGAHRALVGNLNRHIPFGALWCRWDGNIKMDPKEIGWEGRE